MYSDIYMHSPSYIEEVKVLELEVDQLCSMCLIHVVYLPGAECLFLSGRHVVENTLPGT